MVKFEKPTLKRTKNQKVVFIFWRQNHQCHSTLLCAAIFWFDQESWRSTCLRFWELSFVGMSFFGWNQNKLRYPPKNWHVSWKGTMLKGNFISNHDSSGDMLVFRGSYIGKPTFSNNFKVRILSCFLQICFLYLAHDLTFSFKAIKGPFYSFNLTCFWDFGKFRYFPKWATKKNLLLYFSLCWLFNRNPQNGSL